MTESYWQTIRDWQQVWLRGGAPWYPSLFREYYQELTTEINQLSLQPNLASTAAAWHARPLSTQYLGAMVHVVGLHYGWVP